MTETPTVIDLSHSTVIPAHEERPDLSHEKLVEAYNAGDPKFKNFIGGVEVVIGKLDEIFPAEIHGLVDENENPLEYRVGELFPCAHTSHIKEALTSNDGTKSLIRFTEPLQTRQFISPSPEMLFKLMDFFGAENVMTKSEFQGRIRSEEYTPKLTEEF